MELCFGGLATQFGPSIIDILEASKGVQAAKEDAELLDKRASYKGTFCAAETPNFNHLFWGYICWHNHAAVLANTSFVVQSCRSCETPAMDHPSLLPMAWDGHIVLFLRSRKVY